MLLCRLVPMHHIHQGNLLFNLLLFDLTDFLFIAPF